jgi:hypothetical protein
LCSRKIANGRAKPAWVSHTAVVVPARSKSAMNVTVLSRNGTVSGAADENSCSSGMSATCSGTASSDTVAMNSHLRPLKSIHANAYAANAAIAIGMIVAGIAIANEFSSESPRPAVALGAQHDLVVVERELVGAVTRSTSPGALDARSRNELTNNPSVGMRPHDHEQPQDPGRDARSKP